MKIKDWIVYLMSGVKLQKNYYIENHASYSWQEGMAPMINGDAAMYLLGNFIVGDLMRAGLDRKIGYFQFPVIDGSVRTMKKLQRIQCIFLHVQKIKRMQEGYWHFFKSRHSKNHC